MSRLASYAELARLSNLPTCITNVLVGAAIGGAALPSSGTTVAAMTAAVMLLYVGGMALNDVVDVGIDRRERPQRPIPSGRISLVAAGRFVWVCLTLGLGIIAVLGVAAFFFGLALVVTIVLYDLLHKKVAASVLLMGLCRGLVYLTTAAAIAGPVDWPRAAWFAAAITLYIVLLTIVARVETRSAPPARLGMAALLLPASALLPLAGVSPESWTWTLTAAAAVVFWLLFSTRHLAAKPPRIGSAVGAWLAGICLIDGLYLAVLGAPILMIAAAACFLLTLWGHRSVPGS